MNYKTYILNSSNRLTPFIEIIEKIIKSTLEKVNNKIDLEPIDIAVVDQPNSTIPEIGLGGYAPNKNVLYVYTNPTRENFKEIIEKELPRTLAHELHHCARWATVGYGETLLETLISEGLAEQFDIEVNGGKPTQWATALTTEQMKEMMEKAKDSFEDKKYNHSAWFFGTDKENIPRWTGYSLGYHIISEYLKKYPNETASSLYATKAEEFIK